MGAAKCGGGGQNSTETKRLPLSGGALITQHQIKHKILYLTFVWSRG